MRENSFIYKLLFDRISKDSKLLIPELFHSDQFLRPNHINYRACPQCNAKAKTNKQIIDIFGVKSYYKYRSFQSWCRSCRKSKTKKTKNILKNQINWMNNEKQKI